MGEWLRGGGEGCAAGKMAGVAIAMLAIIRSFPPGARRCWKSASRSNPSPQVRQLAPGGPAAQRSNAGAMGMEAPGDCFP